MRLFLGLVLCVLVPPTVRVAGFWIRDGKDAADATFQMAALHCDLSQLQRSLDQGVPIDVRDDNRSTALMGAAADGREPSVRFLLARGADVNAHNFRGWTPLMWAAAMGRGETIKILLHAGAGLDQTTDIVQTALMLAAQNGRIDAVRLLRANGAKRDVVDSDGQTARTRALEQGRIDCARLLEDCSQTQQSSVVNSDLGRLGTQKRRSPG
jgi:ankyrin repeat protein